MRTRAKICCIASVDEARRAIAHGADALGLVSAMPSGPGVISDDQIAEIARQVPPPIATFLLTSRHDPEAIATQVHASGVNTVQIVDHLPPATLAALREALPGRKLVPVIHVVDEGSIEVARDAAAPADALLLDSGNPGLSVKELGGTGRTHDWSISRRIREAVDVPLFLAGGLRPDNVAEAIAAVEPYGVDLCSGVRTDGDLDDAKLAAFIGAVRAAGE